MGKFYLKSWICEKMEEFEEEFDLEAIGEDLQLLVLEKMQQEAFYIMRRTNLHFSNQITSHRSSLRICMFSGSFVQLGENVLRKREPFLEFRKKRPWDECRPADAFIRKDHNGKVIAESRDFGITVSISAFLDKTSDIWMELQHFKPIKIFEGYNYRFVVSRRDFLKNLRKKHYELVNSVVQQANWSGTRLTMFQITSQQVQEWCQMVRPKKLSVRYIRDKLLEGLFSMPGFENITTLDWIDTPFEASVKNLLHMKNITILGYVDMTVFESLIKKWQRGKAAIEFLKIVGSLNPVKIEGTLIRRKMGWRYTRNVVGERTNKTDAPLDGKFYTLRQNNGQNPAFCAHFDQKFFFYLHSYKGNRSTLNKY